MNEATGGMSSTFLDQCGADLAELFRRRMDMYFGTTGGQQLRLPGGGVAAA